jgi:hypothetical protein
METAPARALVNPDTEEGAFIKGAQLARQVRLRSVAT